MDVEPIAALRESLHAAPAASPPRRFTIERRRDAAALLLPVFLAILIVASVAGVFALEGWGPSGIYVLAAVAYIAGGLLWLAVLWLLIRSAVQSGVERALEKLRMK